jgi:uncharacterized protein (DUF488 family)
MTIFTIGHSTRNFEDFIKILKHFQIRFVIDVRRFPSSKKHPQFNKEFLQENLAKEKIEYLHYPQLGGFRKEGYEKFSQSEKFRDAVKKLLEIVNDKTAVIMCAEWTPLGCHRYYISDYLTKIGKEVVHIIDEKRIQAHVELPKKKPKMICEKT